MSDSHPISPARVRGSSVTAYISKRIREWRFGINGTIVSRAWGLLTLGKNKIAVIDIRRIPERFGWPCEKGLIGKMFLMFVLE